MKTQKDNDVCILYDSNISMYHCVSNNNMSLLFNGATHNAVSIAPLFNGNNAIHTYIKVCVHSISMSVRVHTNTNTYLYKGMCA